MSIFNTKRLRVRKLEMRDAQAFHEMESNPNVKRYTSGEIRNFEEDREQLKGLIDKYEEPANKFWIWAVVLEETNEFIGTVAIIVDEKNGGEIGYRFLEKFWGYAYGKEVSPALINYGFEKMDLECMYAYVDVRNVASVKILEESTLEFVKEYWNEEEKCTDRYYKKSQP